MSSVSRVLRMTALAGAFAALAAAPASAQRGVPVSEAPVAPVVVPDPNVPNIPAPLPGADTPTIADDVMALPDLLDRRGNHQAPPIKTIDGAFLNDPAFEPVISPDSRTNRYLAFTSTSTNLVAGSGDKRNMYLMHREPGFDKFARQPWKPGKVSLISKGRGGPANGDSWSASFTGFGQGAASNPTIFAPKCLAFVSDASNLVKGDTNGRADVFLKKLPNGPLKRIKTPAAATEVALDGRCWEIAYIAGGKLYLAHIRDGKSGKKKRKLAGAGSSSPEVSANGESVSYARKGVIYSWTQGKGSKRLGTGHSPASDDWQDVVAWVSNSGDIMAASLKKSFTTQSVGRGIDPSVSAGGTAIYYGDGQVLTSSSSPDLGTEGYKNLSFCPVGHTARQVSVSAHANYAVYGCSNGRIYMVYVDPYLGNEG